MGKTYLCIHGHFYQPPRENPWLGIIEAQPSARPFHDWNERISRECYGPNGRARVLGDHGRITRLVNNYEYMSFNFGPTLLSWMETKDPETYNRIIEADQASRERLGGHGNALAQVYNHMIMPLANHRDKQTQIRWGKRDFESRFGRPPEGMWLAEAAVDTETLELLVQEGIKFTILSPDQAKAARPFTGSDKKKPEWEEVTGGRIDPRRPYRVFLDKSGSRHIDVFFYDGPTSRAVAFERLLSSGSNFLTRLKLAAGAETNAPRLVNLGTDGESYGHHFQFGEMALAWIFDHLEKNGPLEPINYGAFLEMYPPEYEVQIVENSSWSCAHGIERWRSNCGCCASCQEGWNQAWRSPLRKGLDRLRDEIIPIFEEQGGKLFQDPWAVRDDYISVLLDPQEETRREFIKRHAARDLNQEEITAAARLLESQVMSMYMFTSCGWFFDDLAGLEPVQNLKYAARAIDLVKHWSRVDLEAGLLEYLTQARSNRPSQGTGANIYNRTVLKSRFRPVEAAAHFAIQTVVEGCTPKTCPAANKVRPGIQRRLTGPGLNVTIGEAKADREWSAEEIELVYTAVHQGGLSLFALAGIRPPEFDLKDLSGQIQPAVDEASPDRIVEAFRERVPSASRYGLDDLIPDTRHTVAWTLAQGMRSGFQNWIREFFDIHQDMLLVLEETRDTELDVPGFIYSLAVGTRLAGIFQEGLGDRGLDWEAIRNLTSQARKWGVPLSAPDLHDRAQTYIKTKIERLAKNPGRRAAGRLLDFLRLARELTLKLDLWECQNRYYDLFQDAGYLKALSRGASATFKELGLELGFYIDGA